MIGPVWVCLVCKFPVPLDDCGRGIKTRNGRTICTACWDRAVEAPKPPDLKLERDYQEVADHA